VGTRRNCLQVTKNGRRAAAGGHHIEPLAAALKPKIVAIELTHKIQPFLQSSPEGENLRKEAGFIAGCQKPPQVRKGFSAPC
jgi:hypothetical protein